VSDRAALEARLIRYLAEIAPSITGLSLDSEILESGLFDSLALVSLVGWVEEEIGRPIDPATFDLTVEWKRVADVAAFIERERAAPSRGR
jgi:acyl carrier protein